MTYTLDVCGAQKGTEINGSGQECPLYTRKNARDSCESRALCFYLEFVLFDRNSEVVFQTIVSVVRSN